MWIVRWLIFAAFIFILLPLIASFFLHPSSTPTTPFTLNSSRLRSSSFMDTDMLRSSNMTPLLRNPIIYGTAWKKERTTDLVFAAIESGY